MAINNSLPSSYWRGFADKGRLTNLKFTWVFFSADLSLFKFSTDFKFFSQFTGANIGKQLAKTEVQKNVQIKRILKFQHLSENVFFGYCEGRPENTPKNKDFHKKSVENYLHKEICLFVTKNYWSLANAAYNLSFTTLSFLLFAPPQPLK